MKATSVRNNRWSIPLISNTHTWESALPVRRPTSLFNTLFKKSFVGRSPFMYMSALPSCTSFTAVRDASMSSATWMISKSLMSIFNSSATFRILSLSPTRMASAILRSLAALTASSTAESCATATETFFISISLTFAINSSKVLLICLHLIFFDLTSQRIRPPYVSETAYTEVSGAFSAIVKIITLIIKKVKTPKVELDA